MGNCASVNKNTNMKLAVQIESPTKVNTVKAVQNTVGHGFLPQASAMGHVPSFRDSSSREEMFFDSQPWLDSDCEDYFSVNGDLTPSRASTPVHPKSFIEAPKFDKVLYVDSTPNSMAEPSPTDMKKQLIELFRESFNDDPGDGDQNLHGQQGSKPTIFDLPPKSASRSPYESVTDSVCSSERTPYRDSRIRKEKSAQSPQCCIPSLMRSLSFTERKKKKQGLNSANNSRW